MERSCAVARGKDINRIGVTRGFGLELPINERRERRKAKLTAQKISNLESMAWTRGRISYGLIGHKE